MKKIVNKISAAVAFVGLFVAVCTADDSAHELACRLIGVATFIVGVIGWSLTGERKEVA